jgi:hypothetical protein
MTKLSELKGSMTPVIAMYERDIEKYTRRGEHGRAYLVRVQLNAVLQIQQERAE